MAEPQTTPSNTATPAAPSGPHDETERLRATVELLRAMLRCTREAEILQVVAAHLARTLGADRAAVMLLGAGPGELRIVASAEDPQLREMAVDLGRYPEIRCSLDEGRTVFIQDARHDPILADVRPLIERLDIRQVAVVPMRWNGVVLGTLFLRTTGQAALTADSVRFCERVAALAAEALYHAYRRDVESRNERYRRLVALLRALAEALERPDRPADAETAARIAEWARRARDTIEGRNG
jgi:GAF domain-containing protein